MRHGWNQPGGLPAHLIDEHEYDKTKAFRLGKREADLAHSRFGEHTHPIKKEPK